jgi:Fic family protein
MKMPAIPPQRPSMPRLVEEFATHEAYSQAFELVDGPVVKGKYVHWDQLLHLQPPEGLSHKQWWFLLKSHRRIHQRSVPLKDKAGNGFTYAEPDPIPESLHKFDLQAGGRIEMADQVTNPDTKDRYYVASLIEEAITSSQLEGATTTRLVAKEMIREDRPPSDRNEQMILNNYLTMQRIGELKKEPLSPELIFEIHRLITENTHDDPSIAGRFRRADERIYVGDDYGQIFYEPPPAEDLNERIQVMCDFANGKIPDRFIHPVIRSIILHFWLAYNHPFVDGNGRTARAIFYWSMLRHDYWLFEYISISRILLKARSQYARSFLLTETDDNDLTYFLVYQIEVIERAIKELHGYIERKTREIQVLEQRMRGVALLNLRQRALVSHALRHPQHRYTFRSHQRSHNTAYETARKDILNLMERGLLNETKIGKTWVFTPAPDLEQKLTVLT